MKSESKKNLPASVRQRLLTLSQKRKEPFDLVLLRFGVERLLYRLSRSNHANKFLLKGAMLFAIWSDGTHRPTRDVDLLGFGASDEAELKQVFTELCELQVEPDGFRFLSESVATTFIREEAAYPGIRSYARVSLQVDIGFGDVVTPAPEEVDFPALLDFAAPHLRAYPIYTVVAEKLEATVRLSEANTRMKDFFRSLVSQPKIFVRWRIAERRHQADVRTPENGIATNAAFFAGAGFRPAKSHDLGCVCPAQWARKSRYETGAGSDLRLCRSGLGSGRRRAAFQLSWHPDQGWLSP